MPGRVILLIAFLSAVILVIQMIKKTPKPQLKSLYWKLGLGTVAIVLLLLAITGRIHWINAVFVAMLPLLRGAAPLLLRLFPLLKHYQKTRPGPGPSPGNSSQVQTAILLMTLSHDSQQLSGQVLSGPFAGHSLDDLDQEQLQTVLNYCHQQDQESVKLLVSYLNHRFGNTWQRARPAPDNGPMTRQAALAILGLQAGASKQEIIKAHRKMMQKVHPDLGGSDYLAAQINLAKDLLIKQHS